MKKFLHAINPKNWNEKVKYIVCSLLFLALIALFLTWFLEYRFYRNDFSKAWSFVFDGERTGAFYYSALIVWLLLVAIWAICGRPILTAAISVSITLVITYIHIAKYNSRSYPLLPEDFQLASEASTLTKFVDIWSIVRLIIAIIIVCVLFALMSKYLGRKLHLRYKGKKEQNIFIRHMAITRVAILVVACSSFMISTDFVRNNKGDRYEDTFLGTKFTAWNQTTNYNDNGFVLGFLYNLQKVTLGAPEDYSKEKILAIKEKYEAIAERENAKRKNPAEEDVSVFVVLSESFFDPSVEFQGKKFSDYYDVTSGDVLSNYHKMQKTTPSGLMYSLDYGGGTANIEFEAFTSLTNFWLKAVPYTALIPKTDKVPSIAQMLKPLDYETLAIHPFNAGMYKRSISIKKEGFDSFIVGEEFENTIGEEASDYINDRSTFKEVGKYMKDDKRQVISIITMQNHTPYIETEKIKQSISVRTSEKIEDYMMSSINAYLYGIQRSDVYLREWLDELKGANKKVAVLYFGDHSAGVFNNVNESEEKEVRDLTRVTPYFIWTNYDTDLGDLKLPTTTPNCMVNTMLNRLNWQKDAYYYLVDEVCEEQPILTETYLENAEFNMTETLKDYKLITYDFLAGKQYWYGKE